MRVISREEFLAIKSEVLYCEICEDTENPLDMELTIKTVGTAAPNDFRCQGLSGFGLLGQENVEEGVQALFLMNMGDLKSWPADLESDMTDEQCDEGAKRFLVLELGDVDALISRLTDVRQSMKAHSAKEVFSE